MHWRPKQASKYAYYRGGGGLRGDQGITVKAGLGGSLHPSLLAREVASAEALAPAPGAFEAEWPSRAAMAAADDEESRRLST